MPKKVNEMPLLQGVGEWRSGERVQVSFCLLGTTSVMLNSFPHHRRIFGMCGCGEVDVPKSTRTGRSIQQVLGDSGSTQEKEG